MVHITASEELGAVEDVEPHSQVPTTLPADVTVEHRPFPCRRGYNLLATAFQPKAYPATRSAPACLVFHHGVSDHSHRHAAVLAQLCSALQLPVYAYDAHGHGKSGPKGEAGRALVRRPQDLVDDLLDFVQEYVIPDVRLRHEKHTGTQQLQKGDPPPVRVFVNGYSMGGMVASLAVATTAGADDDSSNGSSSPAGSRHPLFAGLLLTSALSDPFYGQPPLLRAAKTAYVTLLSWLVPALPMFARRPVESGIRCEAALVDMRSDRLWYRGKFKVATIASLLWGCMRLRSVAHRISLPLLVQHATVDTSCSVPSMKHFLTLTRVRPSDLTMNVYEGAYHDLHHDPETPAVLAAAVAWLRPRVA